MHKYLKLVSLQKNQLVEENLATEKQNFDSSLKKGNNSIKIRLWETDTVLLLAIQSKAILQCELPDHQIETEKVF